MPRVTLEATGESVDVDVGTLLLRACKKLGVEVPNLCANSSLCGTCMAVVVDGAANLSPMKRIERRTLAWVAAPSSVRLTCQATVNGDVTVRAGISPLADIDFDPTKFAWGDSSR
jgi:adenylate cyclase